MGSKAKKQRGAAATGRSAAATPVCDRRRAPDAATDASPAVETIKLTIVTDPPGATSIASPSASETSPPVVEFVKNNKEVKVTAQLAGYDDATLMINPLERRRRQADVTIKLKPLKGPPKS